MSPPRDPADEKGLLRERAIAARAALSVEFRAAASRAIVERLTSHPSWKRARTVALHASLGAEVDTSELVRAADSAGKRIAWPRLSPAERAMAFAACPAEKLVPGPTRALEPPSSAPALLPSEIDVVVLPGVAFDAAGRRLGRGRGHFDATLALLPASAWKVGLAFDVQVVAAVPAEPHDAPLDAVVTESRLLETAPPGRRTPGG